ncbi:MAG: sigma-54 dependent transcriptional regulator [Thermoanaerobaculia bacterium]|nr:sigma-54 dependent transcriptional regulator [Thermoanaerobaculia bacterium]
MAERPQIVIIDDETGSRESVAIALEKTGLAVRTFDDARRALELLEQEPSVRVAICDLRMPGMDGLAFLQEVRRRELGLSVVLLTAFGSIESAVDAMKVGADDYLTKPVDLYELRRRVTNLLENRRLREEVSSLQERLDKRFRFEAILGRSAAMEQLFEQMRAVAPTRSTVLLVGESGTGKELVANALHHASPRRDERFLAINCGAIPSDILESELFGHEKGSFTGAVGRKIGKFELAHRGTLFLDEISELYPELQVKLLRVLEERRVMRVGGSDLVEVDFRLVAATNRELEREVAAGRFREDLYYRLKVVTLRIPPLRERREDIPLLAEHYLERFCAEHGREPMRLAADAVEALVEHPWPGNVRELRNLVETVVIFHRGGEIRRAGLPPEVRGARGEAWPSLPVGGGEARDPAASVPAASPPAGTPPPRPDRPLTMAEVERDAILSTLARTGGRRAEAARLLDIGLRTLQRKLKEYKEQGYWEE